MTPTEFKQARQSLGLTQLELSAVLGVTPQTVRKWEAPEDRGTHREVNPIASKVMSWMLAGMRPGDYGG